MDYSPLEQAPRNSHNSGAELSVKRPSGSALGYFNGKVAARFMADSPISSPLNTPGRLLKAEPSSLSQQNLYHLPELEYTTFAYQVSIMAITELALLYFKNNKGIEAPENKATKENILIAIKVQASYSSYPVHLLTQIEDPSYLYLLGGWDSVETHVEKWIPSKTNHDLLAGLQGDMEVVWLQHLDVAPISYSPGSVNDEDSSSVVPLSAPVIAITRYLMNPGRKSDFQSAYSVSQNHLDALLKSWSTIGAWRLDPATRDEDNGVKDEFVLFSGWHSVEDHLKFAESKGLNDLGKIEEFLEGAEIKHTVLSVTS